MQNTPSFTDINELIDKVVSDYLATWKALASYDEEIRAWDKLSDEALLSFERKVEESCQKST